MILRRFVSLVIIATACTSAWAVSPLGAPAQPAIRMVEHQRMMIGDKVIYEADVNVLDPEARQYWLEIGVDDKHWRVPTADRSVGSAALQGEVGYVQGDGWMISYLVRERQVPGTAQVDVVYTIRDMSTGVNRTEHVQADVQEGARFTTTTPAGARVWLLVTPQ
ncbi:hypothetical protein [Stenotrophomonas sp.]|uniref:hypothetical protein n=1 Tax=Stenotrophomonas sp. TaxID=69392 RepID=UPI0028A8F2DB|nr:hypothetical protein [Stenotrophomonas sp.]